jgi:hypothetical protein
MAAVLADFNTQSGDGVEGGLEGTGQYTIPPMIKALFNDLSEIRRVALVESPQILPLIAPALIEAEVHVRQIWANQI